MIGSVNIEALHGFLGSPTDWNLFDCVSYSMAINHEELSFCKWTEHFNKQIEFCKSSDILLGYSLGGRLAMHLLLANPNRWSGAILVSAHPGLSSLEERQLRLQSDALWAERFLNESWDTIIEQWNANPVFANFLPPFIRKESEFDRKKLSRQILNWSLGNQLFLLPELKKLSVPILYIAGERDLKFCSVAEQFATFARVAIIPGAAHRVPWDQPDLFIRHVNQFIEEIYHDKKTSLDDSKNL